MAIGRHGTELLLREHRRRPLPDTVHLLGRQTVLLPLDEVVDLMHRHGVEPCPTEIEIDRRTRGAADARHEPISDRTFFGLFGVREVVAIDVSDHEGAEIIVDLGQPIPDAHRGTVDFLYGGSVLDNVFDPAAYLRGATALLRPGGRLFDWVVIGQRNHAYTIVTPGSLFDYFVANRYARCALYVGEGEPRDFVHYYGYDPAVDDDIASDFGPPRGNIGLMVTLFAEKGPETTGDRSPVQDQYRDAAARDAYRRQLMAMSNRGEFFAFDPPTPRELSRLGRRTSRSYRYLGVMRGAATAADTVAAAGVGGLRILRATYGGNQAGMHLPRSGTCAIYDGNATDTLANVFNGLDRADWEIDVEALGDPAPGCAKDLEVLYTVADEPAPRLRRAYVAAEAAGKTLRLPADD